MDIVFMIGTGLAAISITGIIGILLSIVLGKIEVGTNSKNQVDPS